MNSFFRDSIASLNGAISREIDSWFRQQCQSTSTHYYLFYRKAEKVEAVGDLRIATEAPDERWELAVAERISPAWAREQASAFVSQHTNRLPIFNPDWTESA